MKSISLIVIVAAALIIVGCKPKQVKLFEQGVEMYSDENQRTWAIQLLKQAGDLGHVQAFYFLSDKELFEARRLFKPKPGYYSNFGGKDLRLASAIEACDRSLEYLTMAQPSGDAGVATRTEAVEKLKSEIIKTKNELNLEHELGLVEQELSMAGDDGSCQGLTKEKLEKQESALQHLEKGKDVLVKMGANAPQGKKNEIDNKIREAQKNIAKLKKDVEEEERIRKEEERKSKIAAALSSGQKELSSAKSYLESSFATTMLAYDGACVALKHAQNAKSQFELCKTCGDGERNDDIIDSDNKIKELEGIIARLAREKAKHTFCGIVFGTDIEDRFPAARSCGISYAYDEYVNPKPFRNFRKAEVRASVTTKKIYEVEFTYDPPRGVPVSVYDAEYQSSLDTLREKYGHIDSSTTSFSGDKYHTFDTQYMKIVFKYQTEGTFDRAQFKLTATDPTVESVANSEKEVLWQAQEAERKRREAERLKAEKEKFKNSGGVDAL